MTEMKACPFCGREATMIDCETYPRWFIKCSYRYCGVEQPRCYATKEAAIKAWNRRTRKKKSEKFIEIVADYSLICSYPEYEGKPYFTIRYEKNGEEIEGFGTYKPEMLSYYIRTYFMDLENEK